MMAAGSRARRNSAITPISGFPPLVRNCQHEHDIAFDGIENGVRESSKQTMVRAVVILLPLLCRVGQRINAVERFGPKCLSGKRIAFAIPLERTRNFSFCVGKNDDFELTHSARSRALAPDHGTGTMVPSRSPARRLRISARQASEMQASSLPSRLSSNATTSADRSSVGKDKASSRSWSTRAVMRQSLASGAISMPASAAQPQ